MRLNFLIIAFLFSSAVSAQDSAVVDTSWKRGGVIGISFTQVSLNNWAAGGENSFSGLATLIYFANYNDGLNAWDNYFDFAFGVNQTGDSKARKSDDRLEFGTKYGRKAFKNWFYSVMLSFKSQFAPGYNYPDDSSRISDFLSPAYVTLALGMDYKPNEHFSLFISPLAGRIIIVNDQKLADAGAFGVDPAEYNDALVKTKDGEKFKIEFGALLKAMYQKDVMENVNFSTKLELFSNYLEDPQNVDVLWDVLIAMKINQYLSANLSTQLIYDDNTIIAEDTNDDGIADKAGPRTQFKEVLGIGFSYKF
jgi:hypothetical protein